MIKAVFSCKYLFDLDSIFSLAKRLSNTVKFPLVIKQVHRNAEVIHFIRNYSDEGRRKTENQQWLVEETVLEGLFGECILLLECELWILKVLADEVLVHFFLLLLFIQLLEQLSDHLFLDFALLEESRELMRRKLFVETGDRLLV